MVGAGRLNAIEYLKQVSERNTDVSALCKRAIEYLNVTLSAVSWEMHPLMGQDKRGVSHEKKLTAFASHDVRKQLLIYQPNGTRCDIIEAWKMS